MTPIFLDIEVAKCDPPAWMIRNKSEIRARKNLVDPEKIAADIEAKFNAQFTELREESSLMPNGPLIGGPVIVAGVAVGRADPIAIVAKDKTEAAERECLAKLQRGLENRNPFQHCLVTFRGSEYDLPYLAKRSMRHGLFQLSKWCFHEKPWNSHRHLDLHKLWSVTDRYTKGRLVDIARWLGISVDDDVSGAQVDDLWTNGRHDKVAAHAISDVRILRDVYDWFAAAGWCDIEPIQAPPKLTPRPPRTHDS